ncbi:MAG: HU family DNA-binding protein [Bacteroidales bacterium]|nr:HU family DNA-binding protein [Bacteroidales bacterium]
MNKAELVNAMAEKAGLTNAQAKKALDAMMSATVDTLKKGDKLTLVGFGTFSVADKAARKGRNPQTGKEIMIKAKKVVKFKAGAGMEM